MRVNKIILRLLPLAAIAMVLYFSSCWFIDPASELFRIKIDSVSAPPSVNYNGDSVTIKLWGKIGNDTCYHFSHFQAAQDSTGIELAVWGLFSPAYRRICPDADVELAGKEFKIWPLNLGIYTITIRQ